MIWGGRSPVRAILYMCTVAALRGNPTITAYYRRLRAAGKSGKVALIACTRKLIVIVNTLVRRGTPWLPQAAAA
jgi:transposase